MRRGLTIVGALIALAGIIALAAGGISFTRDETLAKVGDAKLEVQKQETVSVPSTVAIAAIGGGLLLLIVGAAVRRG